VHLAMRLFLDLGYGHRTSVRFPPGGRLIKFSCLHPSSVLVPSMGAAYCVFLPGVYLAAVRNVHSLD